MGKNITEKILSTHLVEGIMEQGEEIAIHIDQTLTQDATGTMAYLQFEAMGVDQVKTDLSVSYVDHNTLQTGFENADDHLYLQTVAHKHGIYFSRPGNGICHQVHLERFGVPGKTLLGSDSHTPTGGGLGMIAIGAGGLDVAVAMAGGPFYLTMPKVIRINLSGALKPYVSAKDIILKVLDIMTVKGGVGAIIEYAGPGVTTLSIPERATITNMGAELGATTSVFPSDEMTRIFLKAQNREEVFIPLMADPDAHYDQTIEINLNHLEPLIAAPHSPDAIKTVASLKDLKVDQVAIGSCTNSSYADLMRVANILKGKVVHPDVSLVISPGSRQVYKMLADNGALGSLIESGARILESACGPCIGMGQAPCSKGISVRTFNRNFKGRSGTQDAEIFLASPETAAATALKGTLDDPRNLGPYPPIALPEEFIIDDRMILAPSTHPEDIIVKRGPNIKPLPIKEPIADCVIKEVLLKVEDNITTDHIMPAGAKFLPLRSNIPEIAKHVFCQSDLGFCERALEKEGGFIIGGHNYGQGSSREHAALAPMYLGVQAVITKSFARIHKANLVNFGILPLTFVREEDYDTIEMGDVLELNNLTKALTTTSEFTIHNLTKNLHYQVRHDLSKRFINIVLAGGLLNYTRQSANLKSQ